MLKLLGIKQWDIWQVHWQHDDGGSKPRPALVLSSKEFNEAHGFAWFARISSSVFDAPHYEFRRADPFFEQTGLDKDCRLYYTEVQALEEDRLLYYRGGLDRYTSWEVDMKMREATGWMPL